MAKRKLRFKVKIEGKEAGVVAAITPPVDVPEVFGTRARVPVRGTINGFPFRSSLMPMGGCHMMPVNKTLRDGAGVKPGDIVDAGTVSAQDLNLFKFVDSPEDAFSFLRDGLTEYHLGGPPKKEKEHEVLPEIAKTRP